jgi:uncharacterized phage protein (TIGR01671 family)
MYRQIKFRVWNANKKSWIHGPHVRADMDGVNLFGETILFGAFMDGVGIEELNDCTALQYTGLKDKNGREIFEGDFIRLIEDGETSINKIAFNYGHFGIYRGENIKPTLLWPFVDICEVVGNIFDNKELNEKQSP